MTRVTLTFFVAFLFMLAPSVLSAQAVQLDHFRPAETVEDGFAISRPSDLGHLRLGARLSLDYALNPLVFETVRGDASTETASLVEHQLVGNIGVSLGLLDRLVLYAGLPVTLLMQGEELPGQPAADGAAVGDLSMGARLRLFGETQDAFALALQLTATLPSAQGSAQSMSFAGEDGVTLHPELLAELRPGAGIRVTVDLGARLRTTDRARFLASHLEVGHELTWALGLAVPVVESVFEISAEAFGSTVFESFGSRAETPIEALLGLRVMPTEGLAVGLAGGLGLARGYGAPDVRVVLTLGYTAGAARTADGQLGTSAAPGPGRSGDVAGGDPRGAGGSGEISAGPPTPAGGSGVGPDPERTGSDQTGSERTGPDRGTPPPDRDGDGVPDESDGAPDDPEDRDGFQDDDGVPDPDNDGDSVLDVDDGCPLAPGEPAEHGCPTAVQVDMDGGRILILERVEFATNRAEVLERSMTVLEQVRGVLAANAQIRGLRVEGHTDDRGRDTNNLDLSTRRAATVVQWLVDHGIDRARLTGVGCGEVHPIETNRSRAGRQANRRVEFHITDPAPRDGARAIEGCRAIE